MTLRRCTALAAGILLVLVVLVACGGDDGLKADAGSDVSVAVAESPTFDGCGSNGNISNYQWAIVEAPTDMQKDLGKLIREFETECSFMLEAAMIAEEAGTWVVELTVSDDAGKTSADTVSVQVTP